MTRRIEMLGFICVLSLVACGERDPAQASCSAGNQYGCMEWGRKLVYGEDVEMDVEMGLMWLQDACNRGATEACTQLGVIYHQGDGVPADFNIAVNYYDHACKDNDAVGCLTLGMVHLNGMGTVRNVDVAKPLIEKACTLKDEDACAVWTALDDCQKGDAASCAIMEEARTKALAGYTGPPAPQ